MVWKQVSIETNDDGVDLISSIFLDAGAGGVEIEGGDVPVSKQDEYLSPSFSVQKNTYVKAYFGDTDFENTISYLKGRVESLKNSCETSLGTLHVRFDDVQDTDWNANFKKHFTTFRAAGNIVIKPTWEDYDCNNGDIVIEMDPGLAFGSGTHETTKMCLELVQKHMRKGADVLDVGCGSGILGIASAKLGAGRVLALDNDSVSVDVAQSNARANNVLNFNARKSDLLQNAGDSRYDIVIANIIADVILRLNSDVSSMMAQDAVYIMSGIIEDRLDDVLASLERNGFDVIETLSINDWRAVAARDIMRRFFVDSSDIDGDKLIIRGDEARHMIGSVRMQVGDTFIAIDGSGTDYTCRITNNDKDIEAAVLSKEQNIAEPKINVTLYQAYPKSAKMQEIVQKAVELGAVGIVPFISKRCVKRPKTSDTSRLERVALSASKQCGRAIVPEVSDVLSFDDACARMSRHDMLIVCWEEETTTSLKQALNTDSRDIGVVIGSEGGFKAQEIARFTEMGGVSVTIGPRILRTETAGIAVLAAIFYDKEQMQF